MLRQRVTKDPRVSAWDHACIEKLKPTDFTDSIATRVVDKLSSEETAEATAWFRTSGGKKFVQLMFDNIKLGEDPNRVAQAMTADELLAMRAFVDQPVGKKIYVDKLMEKSGVMDAVGKQLVVLMTKCRGEQKR